MSGREVHDDELFGGTPSTPTCPTSHRRRATAPAPAPPTRAIPPKKADLRPLAGGGRPGRAGHAGKANLQAVGKHRAGIAPALRAEFLPARRGAGAEKQSKGSRSDERIQPGKRSERTERIERIERTERSERRSGKLRKLSRGSNVDNRNSSPRGGKVAEKHEGAPQGGLGHYSAPRTKSEVDAQFDSRPWRWNRSGADEREIGGVPRISEIAFGVLRRSACAGGLKDLDSLPDDIAIRALSGASEAVLSALEETHPHRVVVLDACWAALAGEKNLAEGFSRWREMVEFRKAEEHRALAAASRRLRERYEDESAEAAGRRALTTNIVGVSAERRRARGRGAPSVPVTAIGRIRRTIRKERAMASVQRRHFGGGRGSGSGRGGSGGAGAGGLGSSRQL